MSQYLRIHPHNPQQRLIMQAADTLSQGGVVVYPTDSCYAVGCRVGEKAALDRIRKLRNVDESHPFSLLCRNLAELGTYAQVSNSAFRLIKRLTPGPYAFILAATQEMPRRMLHPKRKTIGLRVPDNEILQHLLSALGAPLMSASLELPEDTLLWNEPEMIQETWGDAVDMIIDGGNCGRELTTVIEWVDAAPVVIRQGKGSVVGWMS